MEAIKLDRCRSDVTAKPVDDKFDRVLPIDRSEASAKREAVARRRFFVGPRRDYWKRKKFNRIKGYREIEVLNRRLNPSTIQQERSTEREQVA